ncbi:MAG: hypothetical protein J5805_00995 [Bacteroidaceae bacterium]|nr:hypothetical protein [Bacteroidaceae bacterium]
MKQFLLSIFMMFALSMVMNAQDKMQGPSSPDSKMSRREKKAQERMLMTEDTRKSDKYSSTVYMFALSSQIGDSIVYISEIMPVENVQLTKKYSFLSYRSDYSSQFKQYLADNHGCQLQTPAVFYDKDQKNLMKRFNKVLKRYTDDKNVKVKIISQDQFKFKLPEFQNVII